MVIITLKIGAFNYFLRFDENYDDAWAEGLRNNATLLTPERAEEILSTWGSDYVLSIEDYIKKPKVA